MLGTKTTDLNLEMLPLTRSNKMGCYNDPAWKVCGWLADTNYLYPARWGWIKKNETAKVMRTMTSEELTHKYS